MYRKVYVEITNVCNMSCSFCHGHQRAPRLCLRGAMPTVRICTEICIIWIKAGHGLAFFNIFFEKIAFSIDKRQYLVI